MPWKLGNIVIREGSSWVDNNKIRHPSNWAIWSDAEKKAKWIIRSLLQYDVEVFKVPIDDYEDIGSMSPSAFKEKLSLAQPIDNEMYFLEKMLNSI